MSYTKLTGTPCAPGETAVQLDSATGPIVAVKCDVTRNPTSNQFSIVPQARWIDAGGAAKTDPMGHTVQTTKTLTMSPDDMARLTPDAVVKECLLLVLGEPLTADPKTAGVTLIPWTADVVAQCSIRNAITAASVAAPAASEVL